MDVNSIHTKLCLAWERYSCSAQTLAETMRKQMGSRHSMLNYGCNMPGCSLEERVSYRPWVSPETPVFGIYLQGLTLLGSRLSVDPKSK